MPTSAQDLRQEDRRYAPMLADYAKREFDLGLSDVVMHEMRVAASARALAEASGMAGRELDVFTEAVRFHDVGKIKIDRAILRKPGRLDDGERAAMQTHAARGAAMLEQLPHLPAVFAEVARYHHERWDGLGYEGLSGEAIPFAARVCAIADVHDALVAERDYKSGMPEHEALALMTRDVPGPALGRDAFDPELLRRFVAIRTARPGFEAPSEVSAALSAFARGDEPCPAPAPGR